MKHFTFAAAVAAAALALAACGSGDDSDAAAAGSDGTGAVSVGNVDGVGNVLVDGAGNTLYTADEEAGGVIRCVDDACLSFWLPVPAEASGAAETSGISGLGVIERPDGMAQMAIDGRPLYTFSEDSPGEASGDGFSDDFGGQQFTWRAVQADGTTAEAPANTDTSGDFGY